MKSSRRRAREFAVQGLYQWQVAKIEVPAIAAQMAEATGFNKIDTEYFKVLLEGVTNNTERIESALTPMLDRTFAEVSPIERGILMLATYELAFQPETPYRVIINEAIELAKTYGGTDGHKYVNGVLDKLAQQLRAGEAKPRTASA